MQFTLGNQVGGLFRVRSRRKGARGHAEGIVGVADDDGDVDGRIVEEGEAAPGIGNGFGLLGIDFAGGAIPGLDQGRVVQDVDQGMLARGRPWASRTCPITCCGSRQTGETVVSPCGKIREKSPAMP